MSVLKPCTPKFTLTIIFCIDTLVSDLLIRFTLKVLQGTYQYALCPWLRFFRGKYI